MFCVTQMYQIKLYQQHAPTIYLMTNNRLTFVSTTHHTKMFDNDPLTWSWWLWSNCRQDNLHLKIKLVSALWWTNSPKTTLPLYDHKDISGVSELQHFVTYNLQYTYTEGVLSADNEGYGLKKSGPFQQYFQDWHSKVMCLTLCSYCIIKAPRVK